MRRQYHRGTRRGVSLLGALATCGLMAGSLAAMAVPAAADTTDEGSSSEEQGTAELPPTMLIMDASGSMAADDGDASGMTRMEAARQAVGQLVDGVPDEAALGLVVYGANVSSAPEDQEEGCADIEVLASPGVGQAEEITNTVSDIDASGYTPIGESLRAADGELPDQGERSIILVSDGVDTCAPPPPCEVAAELADAGVDLTLHAIGFKVDDDARADLECIAEEGGGTYADAENADELADEMSRAAMRGMRGYETGGEPITGGQTPMQATEVTPGDYIDVLEEGGSGLSGSGGSQKYYRMALNEGERLHLTATMVGPDGTRSIWSGGTDNARLNMGMISNQEDQCVAIGDNSGSTLNMNDGLIAWGVSEPIGSEDCQGSEMIFGVERAGSLMSDQPFDVELLVRTEPVDLDTSQMPPPATEPEQGDLITSFESSDQDSVLFGTSFADATSIEPGTYSVRVVTGERNFVRVPVEYGQTMRFAVEIEDGPEPDVIPKLDDIGRFGAVVVNPLRQPVPLWDGEELTEGVRTSTSVGNGFAANMPTAVNFANRDSEEVEEEELQQVYLGGEQYLMIGFDQPLADQDADAEQLEWTYNLVVEVEGEVLDGPEPPSAESPDATQDAATFEPEQDEDRSTDHPRTEGEDEDETADNEDSPAPVAAGGSNGQGTAGTVLPFVLGGGALLLLGGAGAWLAVRQLKS